ncbi:hypothetical protein [Azonexus sp.]|uniref:hypothetical protein n=1 Tax=Azonexus sp. TaxID=1872668 RepID=UPI0027B92883|nr:hypothetical protein [Azonexus sp.]
MIAGLVSQMVRRKSDDIEGSWEDIEIELTGEYGWMSLSDLRQVTRQGLVTIFTGY